MAMGTRKHRQRQEGLWYGSELPEAPGHPFYQRLNQLLDKAGFDEFCESRCRKFYHQKLGRPSLVPGMYFRLMLIGFFEGIDSERGIAWRVADSLCLRQFLQIGLDEPTPDHVTISRTRRLMDEATHQEVFGWVLRQVAQAGLLKGKTIGIDATTLEANAAMKSIVRRDTQESYTDYLKRLAEAEGLEATDEAALRRMDRRRSKKGSNADWINPHDPEAQITRLKDGRTALAYKAEHAVDMDTGAIVAVTAHGGAAGDTASIQETLPAAGEAVAEQIPEPTAKGEYAVNVEGVEELVADKGYHAGPVLAAVREAGVRTYVSEPDRGRRKWTGKREQQVAVYANRRRVGGNRGKQLLRRRGELLERTFAHAYETGALRRLYVRGTENVQKKLLVQAAACNLALLLRKMMGAGTPRAFHDVVAGLSLLLWRLLSTALGSIPTHSPVLDDHPAPETEFWPTRLAQRCRSKMTSSDTGC
ncbi:MAG TPA: transposase [Terriglobales bacterium]|nr:transposase [Terriglobales bacterium]